MVYTQLIKTMQGNLRQVSGQYSRHKCLFLHLRNVSTASKSPHCRQTEVVSSLIPVSSHAVKTPVCRSFSLYFTARNKSISEDKDKSISKYQRGTPKPSTAQKGKTNHLCRAQCDNIGTKNYNLPYRFVHLLDFNIKSTGVFQLKKLAETLPI